MQRFFVLMIVVGVAALGCAPQPQTLRSPCADMPATGDGGVCPQCTADENCYVLSNPCQPSASCVPKNGNWAVTMKGCDPVPYVEPPAASCGCVDAVCRQK